MVRGLSEEEPMLKIGLSIVLALILNGCCAFTMSDEALVRAIRDGLEQSVRPTLVEALDKARDVEGNPLFIDEVRTEKVNLVDQMIDSIDRVYPPVDDDGQPVEYTPKSLPWRPAPRLDTSPTDADTGDN